MADLVQGTRDLPISRTVAPGPLHGWGIAQRIRQGPQEVLRVDQGSLYRPFVAWNSREVPCENAHAGLV